MTLTKVLHSSSSCSKLSIINIDNILKLIWKKRDLTIDLVAETYAVVFFENTRIIFKLSLVGIIGCKLRFVKWKRPNITPSLWMNFRIACCLTPSASTFCHQLDNYVPLYKFQIAFIFPFTCRFILQILFLFCLWSCKRNIHTNNNLYK